MGVIRELARTACGHGVSYFVNTSVKLISSYHMQQVEGSTSLDLLCLLFLSSHRHNIMLRGPQTYILLLNGCCHQIREEVRCAGKGGDAQTCQRSGVTLVKAGCTLVAESEQTDDLNATCHQFCGTSQHLLLIATFISINNSYQTRLCWSRNLLL